MDDHNWAFGAATRARWGRVIFACFMILVDYILHFSLSAVLKLLISLAWTCEIDRYKT
jgi:hypothetical protein